MLNIKIFQVFHKDGKTTDCKYIIPIQVGHNNMKCQFLRDNIGDNIAEKNETYCELTAQYWAWKNEKDAEYIGLMHYRRVFDFTNKHRKLDIYGVINEKKIGLDFEAKYGIYEKNIEQVVREYDIILPRPWNVKSIGFASLLEHYKASEYHFEEHLKITYNLLQVLYPEYTIDYKETMNKSTGYFTNMFIMKREYFEKYSEWLFSLLEHVEKNTSIQHLNIQEKRFFGYLSERLLNVWIHHQIRQKSSIRIGILDRIFIDNTQIQPYYNYDNFIEKNTVSIVIASDDNYVPHLGALLESIYAFFNKKYLMDIIILDGGISKENQRLLRLLANERDLKMKMTFCNLKDEFLNLNIHMHFSRATFYRLVLEKILPSHSRVLYIDCDIIVNRDISELFFIDLNGASLGVCFDYIMHHFCNTNTRSIKATGYLPSQKYLSEYVGLGDNWSTYFQAGVMVFDLNKVREKNCSIDMINDLSSQKYWFLDQDILNKYFQNDTYYIDSRWNYVNTGSEIFKGLSVQQINELLKAREDPFIIHYAGYEAKPWINKNAAFAHLYFKFLRSTYWYEIVVKKFKFSSMKIALHDTREDNKVYRLAKIIWTQMPYPLKRLALPLTKQIKKIINQEL